jgi:hypothetical protein
VIGEAKGYFKRALGDYPQGSRCAVIAITDAFMSAAQTKVDPWAGGLLEAIFEKKDRSR